MINRLKQWNRTVKISSTLTIISNKGNLCSLSAALRSFIQLLDPGRKRDKETRHDSWYSYRVSPRAVVSLIEEIGKRYSLWNLFPRVCRTCCILWRASLVAISCLSRARACNLTSMSAEQHTSPPLLTLPHTLSSFAIHKRKNHRLVKNILTRHSEGIGTFDKI